MSSTSSNVETPVRQTQLIVLPELSADAASGPALLNANTALLDSIEVSVSVVVGQSRTTLGKLMQLKTADILTIDRKVDYPVDIVVNGNIIARGQLVVVDDAFGVRVTEVAIAAKG